MTLSWSKFLKMNLQHTPSNKALAHLIAFYGNLILAGISGDTFFKVLWLALAMWSLIFYYKNT
jgi:hypothetical protein